LNRELTWRRYDLQRAIRSCDGYKTSGHDASGLSGDQLRAAWLVLFAVASGCSTQLATTRPPEPELNLVSSGEFALSDECKPEPGRVYRAEFTVRPDGAVSDIHATGDAACARDALARWISSFRYEARQAPASTVVDWMLVEARRGG
jgi:hypothetical protein